MKITCCYVLLLFFGLSGFAQNSVYLHEHPQLGRSIQEGIQKAYNFEFESARSHFYEIKKLYPQHPAYPFSMAVVTFIENFPFTMKHPKYEEFEASINDCLAKCDRILKKNPRHAEALFFSLTANSYMALMHSYSKDYLGAMNYARKTYSFIKQGFGLAKTYPDFHFTSGLFYYYAEQYPQTHPMVKPFMLFFEEGNRAKGLSEITLATFSGHYTKPEAYILLSYIYLKYENNPLKSLEYSEKFYYNYPSNPNGIIRYIEALIYSGYYTKVKELLPHLAKGSDFSIVCYHVFQGMLQEKHFLKPDQAKAHYKKALYLANGMKKKTDDYQGMAYAGLARIALQDKDHNLAKNYYQKVINTTEYTFLQKEAKAYLDK